MNRRAQLLAELLSPRRPIDLIREELSQFPWDFNSELVLLERTHLKGMLGNFIAGQLTVADIEGWEEAIEGRDGIGFEAGHEELLKTILFELATQELGLPLTRSLAER